MEINKNLVLKAVLKGIIELGFAEDHQDLFDEMFRQLQKKASFEKDSSDKQILLGHPDIHRVLKELAKQEVSQEDSKLPFCKILSSVLLKNLDDVLKSRAVFVLLELIENAQSQTLVHAQLKAKKKEIMKIAKENPQAKGLQILLGKIWTPSTLLL